MTLFSERTIESRVVLYNALDQNKPRSELPKFTVFAMRDGVPCFCLIRVWARNAEDALYTVGEDEAGYQAMGVISGHHTDAYANSLGVPAHERSEAARAWNTKRRATA